MIINDEELSDFIHEVKDILKNFKKSEKYQQNR